MWKLIFLLLGALRSSSSAAKLVGWQGQGDMSAEFVPIGHIYTFWGPCKYDVHKVHLFTSTMMHTGDLIGWHTGNGVKLSNS